MSACCFLISPAMSTMPPLSSTDPAGGQQQAAYHCLPRVPPLPPPDRAGGAALWVGSGRQLAVARLLDRLMREGAWWTSLERSGNNRRTSSGSLLSITPQMFGCSVQSPEEKLALIAMSTCWCVSCPLLLSSTILQSFGN